MRIRSRRYRNLSNYQRIYVKIDYEEPIKYIKDSFKYTLTNPYTYSIIINDVCPDCLFLQLESDTYNTFVFSTNNPIDKTQFYYNQITYVNANSFNQIDFYNKEGLYDITTGTAINKNMSENEFKYNYGNFKKVLFTEGNIGNNNALAMNLYSDTIEMFSIESKPSGTWQILFFISPNLYWGTGIYNINKNGLEYEYIDANGNHQNGNIDDDFTSVFDDYGASSTFYHMLTNLFDTNSLYGLERVIVLPLNYIKSLSNATCNNLVLPMPFTNKNINLPCMSAYYEDHIPELIAIIRTIYWGLLSYAILKKLVKSIKEFIEPDEDNLEVIDL